MVDTLTIISQFIKSPPGQLVAGAVLAGIVWRFFERVEDLLTDDTKLEIAVWLLGFNFGSQFAQATSLIDLSPPERRIATSLVGLRDWTHKSLAWIQPTEKSFKRTWQYLGLATCFLAVISLGVPHSVGRRILAVYTEKGGFDASGFLGTFFFPTLFAALGTHLALMCTKWLTQRLPTIKTASDVLFLVIANLLLTLFLALCSVLLLSIIGSFDPELRCLVSFWSDRPPSLYELALYTNLTLATAAIFAPITMPMLLVSSALMLLIISASFIRSFFDVVGLILQTATRFDVGLASLTRRFDIEHKPLQAIGIVSGAMVALTYWGIAVGAWLLKNQ